MQPSSRRLVDNLQAVRERIADAARRSGRRVEEITLIAVTKYVAVEQAAEIVAAGCHDLAESRPQELWRKADALRSADVRWHLIGHLQRNKVRRTLPYVSLMHSGDSLRLLEELDRQALSLNASLPILLEVNVSGDLTKHGFRPDEVRQAVITAMGYPRLQPRGLMAMAGREGDSSAARGDFRRLRELRDEMRPQLPATVPLDELSMGMSADFEIAIEEGATMVRVGSALFEGVAR